MSFIFDKIVCIRVVIKVNVDKMLLILALICGANLNLVHSLDILGIFPAPVKSHFFVFQPYLEELARRGHNLTVISYFPNEKPRGNYFDIDLSENSPVMDVKLPPKRSSLMTVISMTLLHIIGGPFTCRILLSDDNVQALWMTKRKFDIIIVEQFDSDCALGLAHRLGAPVVGITSHMLLPWHYSRLGVPYNPSYTLFDLVEGGTKPTFLRRVQRIIIHNYFCFIHKYVSQKIEQNILAEFFDDVPPLEELGGKIRMLLLYQNFVLTGSELLPANIKEVGGYHVKAPQPLPDDILKYIEESEHGVIYISFGSNMRASSLEKSKLKAIITALEEFPQRVIWKWESRTLPDSPKNIYISKWLPQNDILAHRNVLAFFSHCGLLGTTEAIYHGVPIVGMPVFGDQPTNAAAAEEAGLGVQIDINDLTKENIAEKLKIVLDPKFRKRVKMISKAWHDRPVSAMNSVIFWTEFAARYNFTFKSRAADIPLYQYLCLDVFIVMLLISVTFIFTIKYIFAFRGTVTSRISKLKNKNE